MWQVICSVSLLCRSSSVDWYEHAVHLFDIGSVPVNEVREDLINPSSERRPEDQVRN